MRSLEQIEFEHDMETFVDMYEAALDTKAKTRHIHQQPKVSITDEIDYETGMYL